MTYAYFCIGVKNCRRLVMKITAQNSVHISKGYAAPVTKSTYVTSNSGLNGLTSQTNLLDMMNSNYNQLLVNKTRVSFGDNLPVPVDPVSPLEKKIGAILPLMSNDDVILAGPNLKAAQKLFKESVGAVNKVISKVYFVEEKALKASFVIDKNNKGMNELINIDKTPILLHSRGQKFLIKTGEPAFLEEFDKLIVGGQHVSIAPDYTSTSESYSKLGIQEFDFSKKDQKTVSNINVKHISQLSGEEVTEKGSRKIRFADIGGQDKAIKELKKSIIYPMKYPSAYKNNIINRGTILAGGPGTGKTLLAQALANETDAYYIQLNGLEMESKWVGASEENWRNLFQEAKDNQPSIIFIDEFDAVARNREGSSTSRYDDKVVNQLLTLMSDLEKGSDDVFVIVATNKLELLDDAIVRSGRFGKHITVDKPDLVGCQKILDIHSKNKPISADFKPNDFIKELFAAKVSGADIAQIVNDANANAYERTGIFEKMENETYKDEDIENLKIEPEDFNKAIDDFKEQSKKTEPPKRQIGFVYDTPKYQEAA